MTAFGEMMLANSLANSRVPAAQVARARQAQTAAKKQCEPSKGTISATIVAGLRKGLSPQKVLAIALKKHKGAITTIACVYWYKSRRNRGLIA